MFYSLEVKTRLAGLGRCYPTQSNSPHMCLHAEYYKLWETQYRRLIWSTGKTLKVMANKEAKSSKSEVSCNVDCDAMTLRDVGSIPAISSICHLFGSVSRSMLRESERWFG